MFRFALSLLLVGSASASDNGKYYACNTAHLASWCEFVITSEAPAEWNEQLGGLVEHDVDVAVGAPGHRKVVDMDGGTLAVSPKPWTNGDVLVASDAAVTGDSLNYATAFELVAPLRDALMYHSDDLAADADLWAQYTKAFADCGVKVEDEEGSHGTAYATDGVYAWIGNTQNKDIHHYMLQYLEEGAIDLVCLMTDLPMDRCDTIRAAHGIAAGTHCNCWFQAWRDLYGSDPSLFPVDEDEFTDCGGADADPAPATPTPPTDTAAPAPNPPVTPPSTPDPPARPDPPAAPDPPAVPNPPAPVSSPTTSIDGEQCCAVGENKMKAYNDCTQYYWCVYGELDNTLVGPLAGYKFDEAVQNWVHDNALFNCPGESSC